MKFSNEAILIAVVVAGAFLFIFLPSNGSDMKEVIKGASVTIDDVVIPVELAVTDEEKALGLGERKSLPQDKGMLFVFAEENLYPFWMKGMLFDLDILWIGADGTIVDIKRDVPPESFPEILIPAEKALYVLEVNAGFSDDNGIEVGDNAEVSL